MMISNFEKLSADEYRLLKDAIALISILIAGADGNIDAEEKEWAVKVANIRTYSGPELLLDFYKDVGVNFQDRLDKLILALPSDTQERSDLIASKLEGLNPILSKLDQTLAATIYESLTSLAMHVAKASGGFMRMWSISKEEAKYVKLNMIYPIHFPEIDEESE